VLSAFNLMEVLHIPQYFLLPMSTYLHKLPSTKFCSFRVIVDSVDELPFTKFRSFRVIVDYVDEIILN
jgi:hypothetical protein